jgi:hypothetical protein
MGLHALVTRKTGCNTIQQRTEKNHIPKDHTEAYNRREETPA